MIAQRDKDIFDNLFVLEMANNHLGNIGRGMTIINSYAPVIRFNHIKAAIKLQFRDVKNFIHDDYKGNQSIRYIKKTESTELSKEEYRSLVKAIRNVGVIPMATPFDEKSVDLCVEFDMPIIKIASSDSNDWFLIRKIASTKLPVIVSTGGTSERDLDELVAYFENRDIPIAINHCVSLYPTEDHDLNLDQITYLKNRYPDHVIGFSTHEYHDWMSSMLISYGKGARTWERHIDIQDGQPISPYCSTPAQIDTWFRAFNKAREMCGGNQETRRAFCTDEIIYLDALVRGMYAKKDLPVGYEFNFNSAMDDFYMAIPLKKGQLSCREVINGEKLLYPIKKDEPLLLSHLGLSDHTIQNRGI